MPGQKNKHILGKIIFFLFCISIILPSMSYLLRGGYFPMHDDTQPSRIFVMSEAIKDGQFPVRLVDFLGYGAGYPLYNFYAPFAYYLGALAYIGGAGAITSAKLLFALSIILSFFSMYFLARSISCRFGSLLSACLYAYAPYKAVNIFVRGALTESFAFALAPLIFLAVIKIFKRIYSPERVSLSERLFSGRYFPLLTLSLFFLIITHNISALIVFYILFFCSIVIFFSGFLFKKREVWSFFPPFITGLIFALGLSAFFWIPAVTETGLTNVASLTEGGSRYEDHYLGIRQLWDSPWGFGGSSLGLEDGMSFKLGKIHIILSIAGLGTAVYYFVKKRKLVSDNDDRLSYIILPALFLLIMFSLFMTSDISLLFWKVLPFSGYIQFPWRFINPLLLFLSLSASYVLRPFKGKRKLFFFIIIFVVISANYKHFSPQYLYYPQEDIYISSVSLEGQISEISDEYFPLIRDDEKNEIRSMSAVKGEQISLIKTNRNSISFNASYHAAGDSEALIKSIYFPPLAAYIDGREVPVKNTGGLILLTLPSGLHEINLFYKNSGIRETANIISFFSVFLLVYLSLNFILRNRK